MKEGVGGTYSVEYSELKNRLIPIKFHLSVVAMLFLPVIIFVSLLRILDWTTFYTALIFSNAIPLTSLFFSIPNYFRQRKHLKSLTLQVHGTEVIVFESKTRRHTKFYFPGIREYDRIWYNGTGYHALRVYLSKEKIISIGSSMKNYELFENQLKQVNGVKMNRKLSGRIENVF